MNEIFDKRKHQTFRKINDILDKSIKAHVIRFKTVLHK